MISWRGQIEKMAFRNGQTVSAKPAIWYNLSKTCVPNFISLATTNQELPITIPF